MTDSFIDALECFVAAKVRHGACDGRDRFRNAPSENAMNAGLSNRAPDLNVGPGTAASQAGSIWQAMSAPTRSSLPTPAPVLAWATTSLLAIGFLLWLGFSWSGYAERYAQTGGGWRKGGTQLVEITLIREDAQNLACASDQLVKSTHCAYLAGGRHPWPGPTDPRAVLRPYSSVRGELLLASGLWDSPQLPARLPESRFTVVCNFEMLGVLRSVALRWTLNGSFDASKESVPLGSLSDCSIPP